jgi:NAD(P)-dependent dehydrogenase (short-subunit alcohol dehydrogenase family)
MVEKWRQVKDYTASARQFLDLMRCAASCALVTGGSSGIGAAVCRALAAAAARLVADSLSKREEADLLVNEIFADGGEAMAIQADISREDDVRRMFKRIDQRLGVLHQPVDERVDRLHERFTNARMANQVMVFTCHNPRSQLLVQMRQCKVLS